MNKSTLVVSEIQYNFFFFLQSLKKTSRERAKGEHEARERKEPEFRESKRKKESEAMMGCGC